MHQVAVTHCCAWRAQGLDGRCQEMKRCIRAGMAPCRRAPGPGETRTERQRRPQYEVTLYLIDHDGAAHATCVFATLTPMTPAGNSTSLQRAVGQAPSSASKNGPSDAWYQVAALVGLAAGRHPRVQARTDALSGLVPHDGQLVNTACQVLGIAAATRACLGRHSTHTQLSTGKQEEKPAFGKS